MRRNFAEHRLEWGLIALVMLVALVMRFRYLLEIEHNVDHAYTIWQAMTTLDRGEFPLAGQGTSVLFANPPLTGYLFIPVVALTRSPLGVYVFVIALNTLAVWFTYRAGRDLLDWRVGIIAAWLVAVNPWIIEYSRTSWVQCLLPFFVTLVFWLTVPVLKRTSTRPVRRTALALIASALLAHTYLLAYFIVAPLVVLGVIYRKRIPARGVVIGGSVFAMLAILYGIGLVQQRDTVQARMNDFSTGESRVTLDAWEASVRLVSGNEYELARGLDAPVRDWATRHDLSEPAHYAILLALLIGMGLAILALNSALTPARISPSLLPQWGEGTTSESTSALILLIWLMLPIIAMSYTSNPVHSFYQLMGIPAGSILAAWGMSVIFRPQTRIGAGVLIALLLPFGALMSVNSARYYQETNAIPTAHDLTALPVDVGLQIGEQINAYLPENGVAYADTNGWIINSFAGKLFPVSTDTRAPQFNYIPRTGAVYVDVLPLDVDESDPFAPLPAGRSATTWLDLADGRVLIAQIMPASDYPLSGTVTEIPSQQGITLVDWALIELDDGEVALDTVWRVDFVADEVPERLFAPFVHVFNEAGERTLIVDGQPVPGPLWEVGDVHVHRFRFSPPERPYSLLIGQFDGGNNANVIFFPPDTEPTVAFPLVSPAE
ncbi:MAG: hypothetical protein RIC84_27570 [Aggregatilineales bacterium]